MFFLRSGFHGLSVSDWLTPGPAALPGPSDLLEEARDAMLAVLGDAGRKKNARLALRIAGARDAHSLWATRPDLMTATSRLLGEAEAHRRLVAASVHFDSLLPGVTGSRRRRAPLTGPRARGPIPQP